jgi:hypothetical protein
MLRQMAAGVLYRCGVNSAPTVIARIVEIARRGIGAPGGQRLNGRFGGRPTARFGELTREPNHQANHAPATASRPVQRSREPSPADPGPARSKNAARDREPSARVAASLLPHHGSRPRCNASRTHAPHPPFR